jgi:hypothetical protein
MGGWTDERCTICIYGHDETTSVCTIVDGWMGGWIDERCPICIYDHDEATSVCTIFDGWMDGWTNVPCVYLVRMEKHLG